MSPTVPEGESDYLVAIAEGQVEAFRHRLCEGGLRIVPSVLGGEELPHPRSLNVALLGVLSVCPRIPEATWLEAIRVALDPRLPRVNERAFVLRRRQAGGPTC